MALNIKPLADRVLIEPAAAETKTASGIIIPDNSKEKPAQGEVVAVGKKAEDVKAGDKVIFGKYSGQEVKVEGVEYLIMKEEDIFGILQ